LRFLPGSRADEAAGILLSEEVRRHLSGGDTLAGVGVPERGGAATGLGKSHVVYCVKQGKLKAVLSNGRTTAAAERAAKISVRVIDCPA
jgi:hypothetical protein